MLRARTLAASKDVFPAKPSPSLSGPLRGLAFGMSKEEAVAAAPSFAQGLRIYGEEDTRNEWLPVDVARAKVRIDDQGVGMIEFRFPSEAIAKKTLKGAWGTPHVGEGAFRWHFWINREHPIRAVLMKHEGAELNRLELLPYRPLAELLADGGELSFAGKHLLDCTRAELAPLTSSSNRNADVQLLPTERSSGSLPLAFRFAGERLERYTLGIDYTYARESRVDIERAIDVHFGAATPEPQARECRRFAPTKDGVHARVCNVLSQIQLTVAGDAASLGC